MSKFIDITGMKFNRLTVLEFYKFNEGNGAAIWKCLCDCGNITYKIGSSLRSGRVVSCGCYAKEVSRKNNKKYNTYDLSGEYGIGYTSNGKEFYFDLEDYDKIKNYSWSIHKTGYPVAWKLPEDNQKSQHIKMHRLILNITDENVDIDHINRIRNDNRKSNLRVATDLENCRNQNKPKNNTSGIMGVSWHKPTKKWIVHINIEKKVKAHLGLFEDFGEAVIVRLKAEKEYYGDFAPQRHLFAEYGII